MNKVPIVFSFDDNYTMPAGVCISSLLSNAKSDTFYDIFVMHSSLRLSDQNVSYIEKLKEKFSNCNFTFIDLKDEFKDAFEIRNITVDAYFRLAIPEYIIGYSKVIYSDVDIIFNGDLSGVYNHGSAGHSLAAVKLNINQKHIRKYLSFINLDPDNYFNSGFLLFNLDKIRNENKIKEKAHLLLKHKLIYQDQDILNITFQNDFKALGNEYNYAFRYLLDNFECPKPIVYHYMAKKPWKDACAFSDIWWQYYKQSIYYDQSFYLDYQKVVYKDCNDHKEKNIFKRFASLASMAITTLKVKNVAK